MRASIPFTIIACIGLALAGGTGDAANDKHPDKLVILSTTDVKGKTSPCGCHIPKGGLSRRAFLVDSLRATYDQVLVVDNGGFFPDEGVTHQDVAWFMIDAMKALNLDAVNVGDRDLKYGRAFLEKRAKKAQLPMVSANLLDKKTKKPVFAPYVIKKVGRTTVGVFGLITDKGDLGPGRDSLTVADPLATATKLVPEMRAKGAQVVVLLSELGKLEGEDLATAVEGIDAVMAGRNVLMVPKGRMIKNAVMCYGGEQGQYACKTELTLDAQGKPTTGDATTIVLDPSISDQPATLALVKTFEDGFNEKLRRLDMEKQAKTAVAAGDDPSHYLGAELCIRCHTGQGEQWKTTAHSTAWQTLVDAKQENSAECVTCHTLGYRKAGGFTSGSATPQLTAVQCESCHGMGTEHDAFSNTGHTVTSQTCTSCHDAKNDPKFDFQHAMALVAHSNTSGESIKIMQAKKASGMKGAHNRGTP